MELLDKLRRAAGGRASLEPEVLLSRVPLTEVEPRTAVEAPNSTAHAAVVRACVCTPSSWFAAASLAGTYVREESRVVTDSTHSLRTVCLSKRRTACRPFIPRVTSCCGASAAVPR